MPKKSSMKMRKATRAGKKLRNSGKRLRASPAKKDKCRRRTVKHIKMIARRVGVSTAGTKSKICGRIAKRGNIKDVAAAFVNGKSLSKRKSHRKSHKKTKSHKKAKKSHKRKSHKHRHAKKSHL